MIFTHGQSVFSRSFSVKTALMTAIRNRMSPELLDALMRIKLHEDTVETFDVNKATSKYLEHHLRCDRNAKSITEPIEPMETQSPGSCPSATSEGRIIADEEDPTETDHTYAQPATPLVQKKPNSECIAIISKASGKALTVVEEEVVLSTFKGTDNQMWFTIDDFIVSNYDGNVIERTTFTSVKLSTPNQRNDSAAQDLQTQ